MKAAIKRTVVGLALVASVVAAGAGSVGAHARTGLTVTTHHVGRSSIAPAMRICDCW